MESRGADPSRFVSLSCPTWQPLRHLVDDGHVEVHRKPEQDHATGAVAESRARCMHASGETEQAPADAVLENEHEDP